MGKQVSKIIVFVFSIRFLHNAKLGFNFSGTMKAKYPFLVLLGACALMGPVHSSHDDWSLNNRFTVYGDFLRMKRTTLNDKHIVLGSGHHLGTKDVLDRLGYQSGYRLGMFYHSSPGNSFEGSYFHIGEWEATSHITGAANLYAPFTTLNLSSDYYNASLAREEYKSRYDSAELNWWHHFMPRRVNYFAFSTIVGLRYLQLDEDFHLAMTRGSNKSTYVIDADNRLYGGQIGGSIQWNSTDNLSWDLMGKAGAFYNQLGQNTNARDINNTTTLGKFSRSGANTGFLGEASLGVSYQLGRYFNIHLGYQFLYLAGVCLAPRQFTLNDTPTLKRRLSKNGKVMMHGAFAGINIGF